MRRKQEFYITFAPENKFIMVVREQFKRKVAVLPEGEVVTARDFGVERKNYATIVKALNQFAEAGTLVRLSKGRYYKPRQSQFGTLPPSEREVVKDFLERDGKVIGYLTGTRAFANLALTTQVSSSIMVGTNVSRRPLTRGQYMVSFLLQPNRIEKKDIPLLVLLDALRLIKSIPASTPNDTIIQMIEWVKGLSNKDRQRLLSLCKAYKPYVRAQLGAIYEYLGYPFGDLQEGLNPTTRYPLGISLTILPTTKNWNIT